MIAQLILCCSLSLLLMIGITFPLWVTDRLYPFTPVLGGGALTFPSPHDLVLIGVALVALVGTNLNSARRVAFPVFLIISLFLLIQDQSRIVLWFYLNILLMTALYWGVTAETDLRRNRSIVGCRLVVSGLYLWGGLNKLNPWFIGQVFPWFVEPLLGSLAEHQLFPLLGAMAAATEAFIGIGLLIERFRKFSVFLAISLHGAILICIGPFGHNWALAVWPWNIEMMVLVYLLFWKSSMKESSPIIPLKSALLISLFFLSYIAPFFWYIRLWNTHLSFHMYSGLRDQALIYIDSEEVQHLPVPLQSLVKENYINPTDWSMKIFSFTPHQEDRVYRKLAQSLCPYVWRKDAVRLHMQYRNRYPLFWVSNGGRTLSDDISYPCTQDLI